MSHMAGNIFAQVPWQAAAVEVIELAAADAVRIERIVSTGQASPPGFWYDQSWTEWVLLLSGAAGLLFEGEPAATALRPGDYLLIPAHQRHQVDWTDPAQPTVWLAVHYNREAANAGRT